MTMGRGGSTNTIEVVLVGRDEASPALSGFVSNLRGIGGAAVGAFGAAAGAVAGLTMALTDLAVSAAPLEGIGAAFAGFTADVEGGADAMLSALTRGSAGMVSNRDLMLSFNQAAQLVSRDFAATLPDALDYVGRVSRATGQDMGFLMESLVRGVGRLSPMILDNLGIQVDLNQAYETYAEEMGLATDAMTRQEQQMAVAAEAMRLLERNVGDLPPAAGSAQQAFASLGVMWANFRDDIGLTILPVFERIAEALGDELVPNLLETGVAMMQGLVDPAMRVVDAVIDMVSGFSAAYSATGDLRNAIGDVIDHFEGMPEVWWALTNIKNVIFDLIDTFAPVVTAVWDFISSFVSLQDILLVVGIAIGALLAPVIAAVLPIIGTFLTLVAVAALLRNAWESNFLGIRDFVLNTLVPALGQLWQWLQVNIPIAVATAGKFWETTLLPALQSAWTWIQANLIPALSDLWQWLSTNIPLAIATVSAFWTTTLLPAIQTAWSWIQTNLIPLFQTLVKWFQTNLPAAIAFLTDLWNSTLLPAFQVVAGIARSLWASFTNIAGVIAGVLQNAIATMATYWQSFLLPALQAVWNFLSTSVFPLLQSIGSFISAVFNLALTAMAGLWQNVILPAIQAVYNWFATNILPILQEVGGAVEDRLGPPLQWLADEVLPVLQRALQAVGDVLQWMKDRFDELTEALNNASLPDWLTPGSPTPFELGLRGINDALGELNRSGLPQLQAGLNIGAPTLPGMTGVAAANAAAGAGGTTLNINLTIQTPAVDMFQISALFDQIAAEAARRGIALGTVRGA